MSIPVIIIDDGEPEVSADELADKLNDLDAFDRADFFGRLAVKLKPNTKADLRAAIKES